MSIISYYTYSIYNAWYPERPVWYPYWFTCMIQYLCGIEPIDNAVGYNIDEEKDIVIFDMKQIPSFAAKTS